MEAKCYRAMRRAQRKIDIFDDPQKLTKTDILHRTLEIIWIYPNYFPLLSQRLEHL